MGSRIALALHVAAQRGIADLLGDGAKSAADLASQAGIPEESLGRLLRALSYVGVFQENVDGRFTNTDVSAYLRADSNRCRVGTCRRTQGRDESQPGGQECPRHWSSGSGSVV